MLGAHGFAKTGAEKQAALKKLKSTAPSGLPQEHEIVNAIVRNHDVKLNVHESCPGAWPGLRGDTIGDYFSALVGASSKKDYSATKLRVSAIAGQWETSKEPGWHCEFEYFDNTPEIQWTRGITFFMKASDRSVMRESFACPGTP